MIDRKNYSLTDLQTEWHRRKDQEPNSPPPFAITFEGLRPAAAFVAYEDQYISPEQLNWPVLQMLILSIQNGQDELLEMLPKELMFFVNDFNTVSIDKETGERIVSRQNFFLLLEELEKFQTDQPELFNEVATISLNKALEKFSSTHPMAADRLFIEGRPVPIKESVGILTGAATWNYEYQSKFYSRNNKLLSAVLNVPAVDSSRLMEDMTKLVIAMDGEAKKHAELLSLVISPEKLAVFEPLNTSQDKQALILKLTGRLFKSLDAEIMLINWLAEDERTYPVAKKVYQQFLQKMFKSVKEEEDLISDLAPTPQHKELIHIFCATYLKSLVAESLLNV